MEINITTQYMSGRVRLEFGKYGNKTIAIQGFTLEGEPQFCATVALDEKPMSGCVFLKGWSENEGLPEALVQAGIVAFTGRTIRTGHVEAVEAKLLVELDNN